MLTMWQSYEYFDGVFESIMDKYHFNGWYELFDSIYFEEVEKTIARDFDEEDAANIPFYLDWYNEMAEDL